MSNEHKNPKENQQITQSEDTQNYYHKGVYVRDDHCDWGFKWNERIHKWV